MIVYPAENWNEWLACCSDGGLTVPYIPFHILSESM